MSVKSLQLSCEPDDQVTWRGGGNQPPTAGGGWECLAGLVELKGEKQVMRGTALTQGLWRGLHLLIQQGQGGPLRCFSQATVLRWNSHPQPCVVSRPLSPLGLLTPPAFVPSISSALLPPWVCLSSRLLQEAL